MKRIAKTGLFIGAMFFCLTSCNQEQGAVEEAQETNEQRAENTQREDQMTEMSEFMTKAASNGMFEVEAGQLAQQKAQNKEVKDYGQMVVNDHKKANDQLKQLAQQKNIALPDSMGQDMMDKMKELRNKSGKEFSQTYMDMMVSTHEDAVELFEDASNNIEDAEVKNFASSTLPTLRQHLDRAKQLKETVNKNQ